MIEVTDKEYQAIKDGALLVNRNQLIKSITEDELKLIVQYLCRDAKDVKPYSEISMDANIFRTGKIRMRDGSWIEFAINRGAYDKKN